MQRQPSSERPKKEFSSSYIYFQTSPVQSRMNGHMKSGLNLESLTTRGASNSPLYICILDNQFQPMTVSSIIYVLQLFLALNLF